MVNKIHIIGGAGGGKTTLAKKLGDALAFPYYDLDTIAWKDHQKVPLENRIQAVGQICAQPSWITEGIFLWWTETLLHQADAIIWLDLPFPVTGWRILKRHVLADLRGNNPHPGFLNLFNFLSGVMIAHYQRHPITPQAPDDDFAITRIGTRQFLAKHTDRLVRCRSQKQVDHFTNRLLASR